MSEIGTLGAYLVSWEMVAIVALLILRRPIVRVVDRLVGSRESRAKIGPIEVELGELADSGKKAVSQMNRINQLMAESRLLELEVTHAHFSPTFSEDQRNRLEGQITALRDALESAHEIEDEQTLH